MPGIFDDVNSWLSGQDMADQGGLYRPEDYRTARNQLLMQLGAGLQAPRAQRGEIMAGALPAYRETLQGGFKERQVAEDYQKQQKFDEMMQSGDLSQMGFNQNQMTILRGMPRDVRNKVLSEAMTTQFQAGNQNGDGLYGVPIWGTDAHGKPVLLQMPKQQGPLQATGVPEGVQLLSPAEQAGMKTREQTAAEIETKAKSQLGDVGLSMSQMQNTLNSLLTDEEGLSWYGGDMGETTTQSPIVTRSGYNYRQRVETLKSQYFPVAIVQMVGLGALSDAEGRSLIGQLGSLAPGQGPDQTKATLNTIKQFLDAKWANYQAKAGQEPQPMPTQPQQQQQQIPTYNPDTGIIE